NQLRIELGRSRNVDAMNRLSPRPLIQFRLRQRIACCRNQVIIRRNRAAISGARKNVKNQTDPECSAAIFARASNFERLSSDSHLANLCAKWACEIDHATESGTEAESSWNFFHEKYLLT